MYFNNVYDQFLKLFDFFGIFVLSAMYYIVYILLNFLEINEFFKYSIFMYSLMPWKRE